MTKNHLQSAPRTPDTTDLCGQQKFPHAGPKLAVYQGFTDVYSFSSLLYVIFRSTSIECVCVSVCVSVHACVPRSCVRVCVCVCVCDDDDELMLNVLRCHLTY